MLARKQVHVSLSNVPHVILVKVHNAKELMKVSEIFTPSPTKQRRPSVMAGFMSNFGTDVPDAYVLVNTVRSLGVADRSSPCYSTAKTGVVAGSFDPAWEEEVRLSMVGSGFVVLNVFSKSMVAEDIFLGQACIDLQQYRKELYSSSGKVVTLDIPVSLGIHKVYSESGAEIDVPDVEPHGRISVSINVLSVFENMCGCFYHIQTNFFGVVSGDKIWAVLCHDGLYWYDSQFEGVLHRKIEREKIQSVVEVAIDKLEIKMEGLHIKLHEGEVIEWAWGSDSRDIKGLWLRALHLRSHVLHH
jgi:hypothetical protein